MAPQAASKPDPITVELRYYTSTANKYRYQAPAARGGERPALGDIYLDIDAVGDDPPQTIEVTVRFG